MRSAQNSETHFWIVVFDTSRPMLAGILGKRQLIAVATAELYDRCYPSKCYKFIEYVSLVMSQMAIGAGS